MAKKQDRDLLRVLDAGGVRKRVAQLRLPGGDPARVIGLRVPCSR